MASMGRGSRFSCRTTQSTEWTRGLLSRATTGGRRSTVTTEPSRANHAVEPWQRPSRFGTPGRRGTGARCLAGTRRVTSRHPFVRLAPLHAAPSRLIAETSVLVVDPVTVVSDATLPVPCLGEDVHEHGCQFRIPSASGLVKRHVGDRLDKLGG